MKFMKLLTLAAGLMATTSFGTCQASEWHTNFQFPNGPIMTARVHIDGYTGYFHVLDQQGRRIGKGELHNIHFEILGGQAILRGDWRWPTRHEGTFIWRLDNQLTSFRGSWSGTLGSGFWNGKLVQRDPAVSLSSYSP